MRLPQGFDEYGLLPPGDYEMTLHELKNSISVKGPDERSGGWDTAWRVKLAANLEILTRQLWQIGVVDIFIDGSFVEDKDHPNDVDGYFVCDLADLATGKLEHRLNLLDPNKVWTWRPDSRKPHPESDKKQLPMWHVYRVELYPHFGQPAGVRDKFGNEMTFPSAFRQSRHESRQKGIVVVKK
jgi:hypothetical protein